MRIVVTGGSGIVGGFVVRALAAAGHVVINASRRDARDPAPGVTFVQTDMTDMGQVVGALRFRGRTADAVIHLASLPNVWPLAKDVPTEVWRVNAVGTYHVVEACATLGIRKYIDTSSINVHQYKRAADRITPPPWPWNEETPNFVVNTYGLSKIAGEGAARMLHARTGAQAISIRPALVIPPQEYAMRLGQVRGGPVTWLTWTYSDAEDLADAYRLAIENDTIGCEAFYIVNDEAFTDRPIEELLAGTYPHVSPDQIGVHGDQADVSNAKAKRLLGWQPRHSWHEYDE
jgi:nucleoside-diphosphate-sugar epimerase